MTRQPVASSSVVSIGYAAEARILEVEFKNGGVYQYVEVPASEHEALMVASSKGQHVNWRIKTRYTVRQMGGRS